VDGSLTSVAGRLAKIIAWFDNEYGYSSRMIDWLYYWQRLSGKTAADNSGTIKKPI
jgi:glyceraldehyde 3-phosphate dehydrogenase